LKFLKISVIMAVFNGEKNIAAAIESILNQTYKDFEFIIVDDGSNDRSYEIIKNYADKDDRIKIIRNNSNTGLTKSLNKAITQAKGEFIARQDDDDISLPSRLELQVNFLEQNPEYSFCGCNGIIKQNGVELLEYFDYNEIKQNLITKNCFAHPSIVIRKTMFEKFGNYDEKYLYGQDYELWCRLIYKLKQISINLRDKSIIMNIPVERLLRVKNRRKFIIQKKNYVKTKLKYLRYSENKIKGFFSILREIFELTLVVIFNRNN